MCVVYAALVHTYSVIQYRAKVPPRDSSRTGELSGIFPGAVVVRGQNWRWEDQDGTYMRNSIVNVSLKNRVFMQ